MTIATYSYFTMYGIVPYCRLAECCTTGNNSRTFVPLYPKTSPLQILSVQKCTLPVASLATSLQISGIIVAFNPPQFSTTRFSTSLYVCLCYSFLIILYIAASMATLSTTLPTTGHTPAIIVPGKPDTLSISYQQLNSHVLTFQKNLAHLGIAPQAAVSIALPNSYEFVVAFLAASWQRAIAAPLNPAYKQEEFEFYIDDLSSAVTLVPRGSFYQDGPAVRAARKYKAAVAECYWNGHEVVLEIKDSGKLSGKEGQEVQKAQPDDIALVLHTSGTTGRPKAVRPGYR